MWCQLLELLYTIQAACVEHRKTFVKTYWHGDVLEFVALKHNHGAVCWFGSANRQASSSGCTWHINALSIVVNREHYNTVEQLMADRVVQPIA